MVLSGCARVHHWPRVRAQVQDQQQADVLLDAG
jgi:hypothetical protein